MKTLKTGAVVLAAVALFVLGITIQASRTDFNQYKAQTHGDHVKALAYLARGLELRPGHAELMALQAELDSTPPTGEHR